MTGSIVVVDASALAEYLLWTPAGEQVAEILATHGEVQAPHLVVTETLSVLRGWVLGGKLGQQRAATACADLGRFPVQLWDARRLTERVWALRDNVSAYDATYVALAEALDCVLVSGDARLARGVGSWPMVHLVR